MRFRTDTRAISPIIGAILVVAVAIILSAVIGTFLISTGGSLSGGAQAGLDFDSSADNGNGQATVSVITMQNSDSVEVTATVVDGDPFLDGGDVEQEQTLSGAGDSATFEGDNVGTEFDVRIVAVAQSGDSESVVLDQVVAL